MSRKVDAAPAIESSQEAAGKHVANASPNGPERQRHGILRRRRKASARVYRVDVCPACGLRIRDKVAARLGFCDQCHEFTGMCGAGRRVVCPDMMTRTSWHTPCTELGAVAWAINQGQGLSGTMLCHLHDAQVRSGGTPWLVEAAPLDQASGWRPPQSGDSPTLPPTRTL
jgi:ribosomal protein L37AE/L43A